MSTRDEGLIPMLEDQAYHDDIIAVTVEPSVNKEHDHQDDSSSTASISSAPSVDHFNISVRTPSSYNIKSLYSPGNKVARLLLNCSLASGN